MKKRVVFCDIFCRKAGVNYHGGYSVKLVRTPSGGSATAVYTDGSIPAIYDYHVGEGAEVWDTDKHPWNLIDNSPGGDGSTAITYKIQVAVYAQSGAAAMVFHAGSSGQSNITLIEVGA